MLNSKKTNTSSMTFVLNLHETNSFALSIQTLLSELVISVRMCSSLSLVRGGQVNSG